MLKGYRCEKEPWWFKINHLAVGQRRVIARYKPALATTAPHGHLALQSSPSTSTENGASPTDAAVASVAENADSSDASSRAGDRGRTGDVQLGKLAFYR